MILFLSALSAFIGTACLTHPVKTWAFALNATDIKKPSWRKQQENITPRMGGLSVGFGASLGIFLYHLLSKSTTFSPAFTVYFFIGFAALLLLGLYDDIWGASAAKKCIVQILIGCMLHKAGFGIEKISFLNNATIDLGVYAVFFTVAWTVVSINGFNLIDGLDGLATGHGILYCLAYSLYGYLIDFHDTAYLAMFCTSLLFFYTKNKHPASVFLGDTGSLSLGFVFSFYSLHLHKDNSGITHILPMVLFLGFPLTDVLCAVVRRLFLKRSPLNADKGHIHHQLIHRGFSVKKTNTIIHTYSVVLLAISYMYFFSRNNAFYASIVVFVVFCFFVFKKTSISWALYRRRRNSLLHKNIKNIQQKEDITNSLNEFFNALGSEKALISIHFSSNTVFEYSYLNTFFHTHKNTCIRTKTFSSDNMSIFIHIQWNSHCFNPELEDEWAVDTLQHHLHKIFLSDLKQKKEITFFNISTRAG